MSRKRAEKGLDGRTDGRFLQISFSQEITMQTEIKIEEENKLPRPSGTQTERQSMLFLEVENENTLDASFDFNSHSTRFGKMRRILARNSGANSQGGKHERQIQTRRNLVLSRAAACDGNYYTISYSCHQKLSGTLLLN